MPGAPFLPERPPPLGGSALRQGLLVGLALVAIAGAGFVVRALLGGASIEPTAATQFEIWADAPIAGAGAIALACSAVGLVGWFLGGRRRRLLWIAAAAILAGVGVLAGGEVEHAGRAHPESGLALSLQRLELPVGYTSDGIHIDHPGAVDGPAATRRWATAVPEDRVCADLTAALARWAGRAIVGTPATPTRCYLYGRRGGRQFDASAVASGAVVAISVRLGW